MNYQYQYPEPEPSTLNNIDPNSSCVVVTMEPLNYLVMCLGAGIGYFLLGSYLSINSCKRTTSTEEVILANPI